MKHTKRFFTILLCAAVGLPALYAWAHWENTGLGVTEIRVASARLPSAFEGFRIAQLSDLHNASLGRDNATLLRKLAEAEPDIIVMTGDMVDHRRTDVDVAVRFAEQAARLAPFYYVTGNHEADTGEYARLLAGLSAAGVTLTDDTQLWLERGGARVELIGLADPDFSMPNDLLGETPAMMQSRIEGLHAAAAPYTILLCHRPELFETYAACGVDLVLCGHAHGGQFRLPGIGGLIAPNQGLFPKYDAGLYASGATQMVVSRGLGNSIVPLRINNRPEIVLIELSR